MHKPDSSVPIEEAFDEVAAGEKYKPWVGVVLSFLIDGAGQYLGGRRKAGIAWFVFFHFLGYVSLLLLASPTIRMAWPSLILVAVGLILWSVMLYGAYRPIQRIRPAGWLLVIFLTIAIPVCGITLRMSLVQAFTMPTHSMEPTIRGNKRSKTKDIEGEPGTCDRLLVQRYAYWFNRPKRGDIVLFKTKSLEGTRGDYYLKRVVALPGERVSIKGGCLFINALMVSNPSVLSRITYVHPPAGPFGPKYLRTDNEDFEVSKGHYFVLGDNSANSADSRYWGPVPKANIIGKATKIYWPPERFGVLE